jgi:preprotein translocase subunit SecF
MDLKQLINLSINQTLSRTIITNGTVFVVVTVLFVFGGPVLRSFSFAMFIGSIVGTYSSIYIASPILIDYVEKSGRQLAKRIKAK